MAEIDVWLKGAAFVTTATFAVLVGYLARRGGPPRLLAAALLLVAANSGIETVRAAFPTLSPATLAKSAAVFASVDPLFLYGFAVTHARDTRLGHPAAIASVALASALLALGAVLTVGETGALGNVHARALAAVTAVTYTAALVAVARHRARGAAPLVLAFAVLALPVWHAVAYWVSLLLPAQGWWPPVLGLAACAILAAFARGWPAPIARAAQTGALVGASLVLLMNGGFLVRVALGPPGGSPALALFGEIGKATPALRWLVVGVCLARALVRDDALALRPAARAVAARVVSAVLVGVAGVTVLGLAFSWRGAAAGARPLDLVVLSAALLASQLFGTFVRRVRESLLPDDPAATERGPLVPGATVGGRYRVVRVLGSGGQGRAFEAKDELLDRRVALKEFERDAHAREAVIEARRAGSLRSDRIVRVHDLVERADRDVLVLELAEGGSLAELLAREGPLPPERGVAILDDVLQALEAAHAAGVIHRDIKPANVLLDASGRAMLADFGLARLVTDATVRAGGVFAGTPRFMAPEQRDGGAVSFATDLYAVGLLARALVAPPVPPRLAAVAERATQPRPEDRFESATAMRNALTP